jgi:hypothetical protein
MLVRTSYFDYQPTTWSATIPRMKTVILALILFAQNPMTSEIDRRTTLIESKVVTWRRDFHEHPELEIVKRERPGLLPIICEAWASK